MITILTREDLTDKAKRGMDFEDIIIYEQFVIPTSQIINKSSFIIYIDDDRSYHILKNRYADDSPETNGILDLLKLN
jgi:hypothetical protein